MNAENLDSKTGEVFQLGFKIQIKSPRLFGFDLRCLSWRHFSVVFCSLDFNLLQKGWFVKK